MAAKDFRHFFKGRTVLCREVFKYAFLLLSIFEDCLAVRFSYTQPVEPFQEEIVNESRLVLSIKAVESPFPASTKEIFDCKRCQ